MSQLLTAPTTLTSPPSTAELFKHQEASPVVDNPPIVDIPAGVSPQNSVVEPAAPPPTVVPQGDVQSPAQPPAGFPAYDAQWQQQLMAERQAYAQREQQWLQAMQQQQAELEAARKAQAELDAYKQQAALQQQLASDEVFNSFQTLAPDEARQLVQIATGATQQMMQQQREELARQQAAWAQHQQQMQQQTQQQARQRTSQEILAKHPDFYNLYNTPQFQQFMMQRDGLSSKTREQLATEEFYAGNSAYVIDLLDKYKGAKPQTAPMQQVPPAQVASTAGTPQGGQQQPALTLGELNTLMQTRRITPDQYRKLLPTVVQPAPLQPPA